MNFFSNIKKQILTYSAHVVILIALIFISKLSNSQIDTFKQYRKAFNECEENIRKGKFESAISCYFDLSKVYPSQTRSYIRLAELYYKKHDKSNTLKYANKAIDLNANEAYAPLTYLANKMNSNQDVDLALLILNRLSVSTLDSAKQTKAEDTRDRFTMKSYADKSPVPGVELINLGAEINTAENEYLPSLSLDGNTLVFTRNVGGNEDFFISKKDTNDKWLPAINLGYPPNTSLPDGGAKLSADGHYLFYTRCDMRSPNGIESGGCDIAYSYRSDSVWSAPQYFGYTINTTGYEGQPSISSDNHDLYFVSNREGGFGGLDIWVSHFDNNVWSKPENLGPTVNTSKNETSPFIHPDNETLYFSSDGHIGIGSTDLFVSRRNKNGTWKKPINLGAPINTESFDGSIVVNAKGTIGYCASDRKDGKGGLDIYSFDIYPSIQPVPTICLKGFVMDKYYKSHLTDRNIDITYLFNNTSMGVTISNEGDGSYTKALQLGKKYMLTVREEGYRTFHKLLDLSSDTLPENYYFNIRLRQPGLKDTLFTGSLQLDSATAQLNAVSKLQLDSLLAQWKVWTEDSAFVNIFIKGYYYCCDSLTDSLYQSRIEQCQKQLDLVSIYLQRKGGIKCHQIMQNMDMNIYNDDEELFDTIEIVVLENY